jgi:hypothetical protein
MSGDFLFSGLLNSPRPGLFSGLNLLNDSPNMSGSVTGTGAVPGMPPGMPMPTPPTSSSLPSAGTQAAALRSGQDNSGVSGSTMTSPDEPGITDAYQATRGSQVDPWAKKKADAADGETGS